MSAQKIIKTKVAPLVGPLISRFVMFNYVLSQLINYRIKKQQFGH